MALIRVCDKCRKHLEKDDGTPVNYVELEYNYKQVSWSNLLTPVSVTLCEHCFEELVGKKVNDVFPYAVKCEFTTMLNNEGDG